ncbi:MAG: alpha/beta hydrolase [Chloroflexales bacterium]|nr:alpha/beta hydrolase [Chloroflexales bacterium]
MNRRKLLLAGRAVIIIALAAVVWLLNTTRSQALGMLTQGVDTRPAVEVFPSAFGLDYEEVLVESADGTKLVGWYIPTHNGAVIMAQHGYKANRVEMLNQAAILARHGYGVLVTSVRAHDFSGGTQVSFGAPVMADLDAWYRYLLTRDDVDPQRIGILGNSYGGMLAIEYAADNPQIKAVVAQSAYSSLTDTANASVKFWTGLPPFPFAPLVLGWAEREGGFEANEIDATQWIGRISPRPVFLMQGGADQVISPDSGQKLYDAAGEPKELWFEPELGHTDFDHARAREYESRVTAFFDRSLGR